MNVIYIDNFVMSLRHYLINMLHLLINIFQNNHLLLGWHPKFYYLKGDVVILNVFGVKHAHHLIGHVILNSVIFAIDKWQKPNLNISLTWFQVTLKILTSYGVALIKSYTDGLPLLCQNIIHYVLYVIYFQVILRIKLPVYSLPFLFIC